MALICDIKERIFTYEGKDYTYDEMRVMLYDGLLETALKPAAAPAAAPAAPAPGTMAANEQEDAARRREIDAILDEELGPVPSERPISTGRLNTDKALKALRGLGVKIIAPGNEQEYQGAIKQFPDGVKSSWGLYDHATRTIYINPAGPDLRNTLFHESAHPVLAALFHNNPALREKFFSQIGDEKMPGSDMTYRQYGDRYADKSIAVRMEESIAQFTADVSDGKVPVSTKPDSLWQRFKAFIQDIMAAMGWDTRSIDLSKPDNVREFAAQFKRAMDKGIRITGLTPVDGTTLSLQDDADRLVDGWYSRLDQAVAAKGNTQSGADWMKWAEARAKEGALSMEEVKWTGLSDWLASKGNEKVVPQQVREFLNENRVRVEVVEKGRVDLYEAIDEDGNAIGGALPKEEAQQLLVDTPNATRLRRISSADPTKFSKYQLPGGTNYREVLVTLPYKKEGIGELMEGETLVDALNRRQSENPVFHSSHFDEPNILVHLRLNDRTGPNGEKILFIEELQSDWGQTGKKKGFVQEDDPRVMRLLAEERDAQMAFDTAAAQATTAENELDAAKKKAGSAAVAPYGFETYSEVFFSGNVSAKKAWMDAIATDPVVKGANVRSEQAESNRVRMAQRLNEIQKSLRDVRSETPSAPFVELSDSWVELGIKQAIRMAVDGGYDRIAWTTGEQQYDRWGSQVFSWTKRGDNWYVLGQEQAGGDVFAGMEEQLSEQAFSEGRQVESRDDLRELVLATMGREKRDWSPENWEKHIDKITDGIWQQMKDGKDGSTMPRREGMKGFYDKILPAAAKKVSKRLGGDGVVSEALIDDVRKSEAPATYNQEEGYQPGDDVEFVAGKMPQQSISIAPAMRERVGLGVPLMQRPKTAGADVVARGGVSEMRSAPSPAGIPANRWNAMVENIRTGFQLELSAAEVMAELKSAGMLKGLSEPQRAALEAKLKQVEKRIASVAKRTGQTKEDIAPAQVKTDESQKVTQAEKLRQSIRRATGASAKDRRANEVNELAREFSMYRPPKDQLDEYIKMAEALKATLEGVKTARVSGKQGPYPLQNIDISNYDPALSNKELRDYNEKLAKLEQDRLDEQLLKDFEKARIEQGLEPASLSIGEVRSIMQSMKAEQAESDAIEKNAEATKKLEVFRLVASMKMQELQDAIKSGALKLDKAKQAIVDNLLKIDAKGLRAAEAAFMANGINNILINDSWGGMQAFAAKGWRDVAVKKIGTMLGRYGKSMIRQGSSLSEASYQFSETWAVAEKIFGRENAADMRSILGINGILNGSAMSSRDADAAINERNKYAKSVGYKDTLYNRYLAGAYAYLIQAKGSTREELEASYDRRMRALEGSANNIFSSETISRKLDDANIDKDLYTRVVRDLIGNSPSLQDLSVPEPIRKMVEWEIAKHEESYAARSFAALTMYNKSVGRENNYTAQRMINVRTPEASRTGYDILEESVGKSMFSLSVAERMASQKQERVGWAEDQVIDLDFFSVQDRARRADLFDTYASPYIAQFREVISDPRLSGVISADAKMILIERVKRIIGSDQMNEVELSKEGVRVYLKTSQRFAGIALKGVSQWFKQPTVLMSTALNIRDAGILADAIKDAMATHDDRNGGTWQHNIAKTQTIYERSHIVGGTEKIGQAIAKTALLSGNETSQEAAIKMFGAEMGRTADAVTKYTIGKPDAIAATITWWAFYRKYLKDNGVDLTKDDWKQQVDESAAAYATHEQERAQSSNIPEAGAPIYRGGWFRKMVLDWMFAYSKFNVNSAKRAMADFRAIRLGAPETKKNAAIDLAARYVEQALFHAVSIAMRNFGRYVIASAIVDALTGTEAEPEDEEKEAAWYTRALVLAGYDFILTGMPDDISNNVFKPTLNKMINEMEGDTGRIKMNYDFFYVPNDGAVNGVMSAGWDEFGNIVRTLNVRSGYTDPEDEEARKLARLSVFLSAMHLMGISDQMLTRSIVSEANRRLKDRALPEGRRLMNEKFVMSNLGELTARGLYHLSGEEEE